jgi:hypothetical protein
MTDRILTIEEFKAERVKVEKAYGEAIANLVQRLPDDARDAYWRGFSEGR